MGAYVIGVKSKSDASYAIVPPESICRNIYALSALAVELTQLVLRLFEDAPLIFVEVLARAIDVEHQHGHGGAEGRGFATGAGFRGALERFRDAFRVLPGEDAFFEVEREAFLRYFCGPVAGGRFLGHFLRSSLWSKAGRRAGMVELRIFGSRAFARDCLF